MKVIIKKTGENIVVLARALGYIPKGYVGEEFEMSRPIASRPYPHFHIYAKEDKKQGIVLLNLHLDQKKPSYKGALAHSGEYEGPIVEQETERIKRILEVK